MADHTDSLERARAEYFSASVRATRFGIDGPVVDWECPRFRQARQSLANEMKRNV